MFLVKKDVVFICFSYRSNDKDFIDFDKNYFALTECSVHSEIKHRRMCECGSVRVVSNHKRGVSSLY